tara:strand:- start:4 stop:702 length:699 start_codon:yes stop_codon:yes gene_type:complete
MKKFLIISLAFIASFNLAQAQDQIYWSEVSMVVESGNEGLVYQAVNDFYSSIDFPENVSVQLMAWQAKTEWREGTHFLNFAGSVEGMSKLRELRSGDAYDAYVRNLSSIAKIVSIRNGNTLIRVPGENGDFSAQEWSFAVKNQAAFGQAFVELSKDYKNEGMYYSLGQYTSGGGLSTHYIYSTHKDYAQEMTSGPKNAKEAAAFQKFFDAVEKVSTYRGSETSVQLATWSSN